MAKAESAYRALREERAQARERFQQLCLSWRTDTKNNNSSASPEMRKTEGVIKKLDAEIGVLRNKVTQERLKWGKVLFSGLRPFLAHDRAVLEEAIRLIEAVATLHETADGYLRQEGFETYAAPKSAALNEVLERLQRWLKNRAPK